MTNPYLIEAPGFISFSGGRTSAYMLKQIIDAYDGSLPANVIPCFSNTGKEMPQTLDFIQECSERWRIPIVWLEYEQTGVKQRNFRIVDHATASQNGEPYEALIRQRNYLPNPAIRYCTEMLKIKVLRDYALSLGWEEWSKVIGLRHDEPRRVARLKNARERWDNLAPLFDAGVTKEDVTAFWQAQGFDLRLPNVNGKTPLGNCDGCFLKSASTLAGIFRDDPSLADWWIKMENTVRPDKPSGARFRIDRPGYQSMKDAVLAQDAFDFGEQDALAECYCTE
jgi:3'-phosphoadenosine 5'-phosphosulfate sulfotransferase (PAPS reductase)/FAD synthetase